MENYVSNSYLERNQNKMPICGALLKYGLQSFSLYILQVVEPHELKKLPYYEHSWVTKVKPSYNIAEILDTFVGSNHPRFGNSVSQEVREKISQTLKGQKLSEEHISNIMSASNKKSVYCYDFNSKQFITHFIGIRAMARELQISSNTQIYRKLNNNKPFKCVYKGANQILLLFTTPLS